MSTWCEWLSKSCVRPWRKSRFISWIASGAFAAIFSAQAVTVAREGRLVQLRTEFEHVNALRAAEKLALERLSGIEREAGQAALKAQELTRRLKLTTEVPCAGTDLQGACKLLGDAVAAKALMPSAQAQISRLDQNKTGIAEELKEWGGGWLHLLAIGAAVCTGVSGLLYVYDGTRQMSAHPTSSPAVSKDQPAAK